MKLYNESEVAVTENFASKVKDVEEPDTIESDLVTLENYVDGYGSISSVYAEVSSESFKFVDKNNRVLFNEYMSVIGKKLGVSSVPLVSTEALEVLPTVAINHHLALEGFVGDMWTKVKTLFRKIYENIKEFFKKHFTRIGRLKNKLKNLKEVLSETDKDIKELHLDKVPSNVASKFPYAGTINENSLKEILATSDLVMSVLEVTNKDAIKLAKQDVLDREFVAKVKGLKDQIANNKDTIDQNNGDKTTGVKKLYGDGKKNNKQIDSDNKTLSEINKENESQINDTEGSMSAVVGKHGGSGEFEDSGLAKAKAEMKKYIDTVETAFNKLVGKPIPGGKTISKVTVTEDSGIELEFDTNKDTPDDVMLGSKTTLTAAVTSAIACLETMEKVTDNYASVNDAIMKNIDVVDSLIKELDAATSNPDYAKYKKVLQNTVRVRLKFMQTFFTTYNKLNKNLIGVVADSCDGVVAYTVASLKNFG